MSVSGPSIPQYPESRIEDSQDRVSFRMITYYNIGVDGLVCRLDVKAKGQQHGQAFPIEFREPDPSAPVSGDNPLVAPKSGVMSATAVMADRKELISSLRSLADELEAMP